MKNSTLLLLSAVLILPSCAGAGIAAGLGATAGVASAQEGGISAAVTDAKIQLDINDLWFRYDVETFRKLNITVDQGRVLLTGVVQNPENRVEAVRLAWQPKGVKQVINEIRVAEGDGITGFARDKWISTRLRTAMTFDMSIQSINYSIDTVSGIVYLMGHAQNQQELNKVMQLARTIPDVKQVVSYVKLRGQQGDAVQASVEGEALQNQDYQEPSANDGYQDQSFDGAPVPATDPGEYVQPDYEQPGYQGIEAEPLPLVGSP